MQWAPIKLGQVRSLNQQDLLQQLLFPLLSHYALRGSQNFCYHGLLSLVYIKLYGSYKLPNELPEPSLLRVLRPLLGQL